MTHQLDQMQADIDGLIAANVRKALSEGKQRGSISTVVLDDVEVEFIAKLLSEHEATQVAGE